VVLNKTTGIVQGCQHIRPLPKRSSGRDSTVLIRPLTHSGSGSDPRKLKTLLQRRILCGGSEGKNRNLRARWRRKQSSTQHYRLSSTKLFASITRKRRPSMGCSIVYSNSSTVQPGENFDSTWCGWKVGSSNTYCSARWIMSERIVKCSYNVRNLTCPSSFTPVQGISFDGLMT
jgi:hypothetical protein